MVMVKANSQRVNSLLVWLPHLSVLVDHAKNSI